MCIRDREDGDEVISLSILKRMGNSTEEREHYLKSAPWKNDPAPCDLPAEKFAQMVENEQFILTITCLLYTSRCV